MADKPGIMIYFSDIRPALKRLSNEATGELFKAIVDYAEYGLLPETNDTIIQLIFETLKPKIDRDSEKWKQKYLHTLYMTYCRQTPENKRLSENDWLLSTNELSDNCQSADRQPITTTTVKENVITTVTEKQPERESGETPEYISKLYEAWSAALKRTDLVELRKLQIELGKYGYQATSDGIKTISNNERDIKNE